MILDENYRITYDNENVILQYHELRVKGEKSKDKGATFEHTEDYFYPTVGSAMKAYVNKSLKHSKSILDLVCRIEDLENRVATLDFNKQ